MSLTSCFCFTILIIDPIVLGIKIVSWKLWRRLSPTMQQRPQTTHPLFPLRRGHRNLVHQIQDQVIRIIQDIFGYMERS
jgi:hypothetical protein